MENLGSIHLVLFFIIIVIVVVAFMSSDGDGATSQQVERKRQQKENEEWNRKYAECMERERLLKRTHAEMDIVDALEMLASAPDFRRTAATIHKCAIVSPYARQALFRKYRDSIVRHVVSCLQQGIDPTHLAKSVTDLVNALAVETFEAEYILLAAAKTVAAQVLMPRQASFTELLATEMRSHQERLNAITQHLIDDDLREQMCEVELQRHAQILLRLTDCSKHGQHVITTL